MPLLILTASWVSGLIANNLTPLLAFQWLILAGIAFVALLLSSDRAFSRWLFGLLLVFCLGAARGQYARQASGPDQLAKYNDFPRSIRLRGVIVDYPEERERHLQFTVQANQIQIGEGEPADIAGRALARSSRFSDWQYGQLVELEGRLETPPVFEDFSYRAYLARQGIHSLFRVNRGVRLEANQGNPILNIIYQIRVRAHSVIGRLFPEPEASLLSGILLGLEGGISQATRDTFDRTGTTHIIAISGFNITIIAGLFIGFGKRWLGARRGSVIAALAIAAYTILVGADAAVLRASLMASIALIGQRLGRQGDGMAALGAAALIMTAIDPATLEDIGFQLSFAATLGLLLYAEPLTEALMNVLQRRLNLSQSNLNRLAGPLSEYFMVTLAAQITTLPLILLHFSRLSLVSPVANLLILPAQPAVMILGGVATVAGLLWLPLGQILAAIAWPFAHYTIVIVDWLSQLPFASLSTAPVSLIWVVVFYLGLLALTVRPSKRSLPVASDFPFRIPWMWLLGILLIANFLTWRLLFDQPDGRLHITLLDTGSEPGVFIQTTQGRRLLIDGGASSIALGSQLDARISPINRQLDWVILSETTQENAAGVTGLIERYNIGGALLVSPTEGATQRAIASALDTTGRPVGQFFEGQGLKLGRSSSLELIQFADGLAYQITYDRARFLLVMGQPTGWSEAYVNQGGSQRLSALLLPGSGDANLSPADQVALLNPHLIMAAVDPGQGRGLPARSLLDRFEDRPFLRTDRNGWIHIMTDGQRLWVEVERSPVEEVSASSLFELNLFRWRSVLLGAD